MKKKENLKVLKDKISQEIDREIETLHLECNELKAKLAYFKVIKDTIYQETDKKLKTIYLKCNKLADRLTELGKSKEPDGATNAR